MNNFKQLLGLLLAGIIGVVTLAEAACTADIKQPLYVGLEVKGINKSLTYKPLSMSQLVATSMDAITSKNYTYTSFEMLRSLLLAMQGEPEVLIVPVTDIDEPRILREFSGENATLDTVIGMMRMTSERRESADYLWKLGSIELVAVVSIPATKGSGDIFFHRHVEALVVALISAAIVLPICPALCRRCRLDHICFLMASIVSQQLSAENMEQSALSRRLLLIASFVGVLVVNIYTASIASEIATPVVHVSSTRDLAANQFQLVRPAEEDVTYNKYVEEAEAYDPHLQRILADEDSCCKTLDLAASEQMFVHLMTSSSRAAKKYFMITSTSQLRRRSYNNFLFTRTFAMLKLEADKNATYDIGIPFQPHSPHSKFLIDGLLRLTEYGLIRRIALGWFGIPWRDPAKESPHFEPASFLEVQSAFVLWLLGALAAVILCVMEVLSAGIASKLKRGHREQLVPEQPPFSKLHTWYGRRLSL